jgi:elongation factor Ts
MAISADQVKNLRARTGAGMMECKKALQEAEGDIEAAVDVMRRRGLAKADKKADRVAAEGVIVARVAEDGKQGVLLEVNAETDFVAGNEDFLGFARRVADIVLEQAPSDTDALMGLAYEDAGGDDVQTAQKALVGRIGENVQIRRFERYTSDGVVATYLHGSRIGVMIELDGDDATLARDLAMHVAASEPICVSKDEVDNETLERERKVLVEQAQDSGKSDEIIQKMVEGRLNKWLAEVTLLGQPFVKDPDQTVDELLQSKGAGVNRFTRFAVGEGKEKKEENFAEEVAAQVKGS